VEPLPPDIQALRATARAYVDTHLIPRERELSRSHRLAPDVLAELEANAQAAGLWLMGLPREYGGRGLGMLGRIIVWEELARTIALPTRGRNVTGPEVSAILFHLTGDVREEILMPVIRGEKKTAFAQTEPEAGSDPGGMMTTAVRDGDDYVISGRKWFIGFADEADYLQVFAATDRRLGSRGGITAFIIPMPNPGVRIVRQIETMMRDRPFELAFEEARVPARYRVGEEGQGFAFGQRWLTEGRLRHAARALGVIERCLELSAKRANERVTFGAKLADRQSIQWMLVDMDVHLRQLRAMTYAAAAAYDRGEDVRYESYVCKFTGDEASFAAADRAMQIHGGLGLTTDTPIETFWRDQRSMIITEGATEVLKMALARDIIKRYGGA
jgi:acyl-CoA dehydrogenase